MTVADIRMWISLHNRRESRDSVGGSCSRLFDSSGEGWLWSICASTCRSTVYLHRLVLLAALQTAAAGGVTVGSNCGQSRSISAFHNTFQEDIHGLSCLYSRNQAPVDVGRCLCLGAIECLLEFICPRHRQNESSRSTNHWQDGHLICSIHYIA